MMFHTKPNNKEVCVKNSVKEKGKIVYIALLVHKYLTINLYLLIIMGKKL